MHLRTTAQSLKGRRFTHRKTRDFKSKIAVIVAQDRNHNIIVRMAGKSRVKAEEIDAVIGDHQAPSSLLCTDAATNYKKLAVAKNLKHETVNLNQNQRIYHIQHVYMYFLDNYLYWYYWLELHKNYSFEKKLDQMFISACQKSNYFTVESLRENKNHLF